ncbi:MULTISPECIES: hypothetical protein [unclassified Streptosporangium]|uniref:hypothetical protein n=1 Tax=unclassified Streptosporangium TaxID=2632669 RepID=UPI002E283DBC|nr:MULTISPECIES: hypothetical protein [unclassified Streptosporangium]
MNASLIRKTAHIRISITIALSAVLGVCVAATLPSAAHATTVAQSARQPAPLAVHDFPWGYQGDFPWGSHVSLAPPAHLADFPWS